MNAVKISLGEATPIDLDFTNLDVDILLALGFNEDINVTYMDDLAIFHSGFDLNFLATTMVMQGGVNDTVYGNAVVIGVADNDEVIALNQGQIDAVMSLVADAKESIAMMV